jgi:methylmalonyl-CoA mutase N-terminal domain/subunit
MCVIKESEVNSLEREQSEWVEAVEAFMEKHPERLNRFSTISDLEIKRLYTPADVKNNDFFRDIGFPNQFPFTRGIQPTMYRGRLWTMRMFAGFGTAEDTNDRFRYLYAEGETGLSTAFDFPTLMGYDTDSPLAQGECGKCGVAIDTIEDMNILFSYLPLDKITTSMTINPPASIIWAMYIANAENQGISRDRIGGTIQNDCLKEFIAQKTLMLPPDPSVKLVIDTIEFGTKEVPRWNPVSISGYHIREAGSTAAQELAFTLSDGLCYVEKAIERGLDVDSFAPRLSFFFDSHIDFFEEIAKLRAARRIWARFMKDRFGAKSPRSMWMRFHTQTAGCSLTAQQPLNNIVRTATEALSAILGGTQSLHTNSFDEVYAVPTKEAVTIALRTQQILAEETGVCNTIDPLAGSYFVEALTDKIEEEAMEYINKIDDLGGMLEAIKINYPQKEINQASFHYQRQLEKQEKLMVGVNAHDSNDEAPLSSLQKIDPDVEERQNERLYKFKENRDKAKLGQAMGELRRVCENDDNVMPPLIDAVRAGATEQEICDIYREIYGTYDDPGIF